MGWNYHVCLVSRMLAQVEVHLLAIILSRIYICIVAIIRFFIQSLPSYTVCINKSAARFDICVIFKCVLIASIA